MDDKADDAPEKAELAAAMSCIQRILLDGLRHGHFRYEITGSVGKNLRREVIVDAGMSHKFIIPLQDLER